MKEKSPIDKLLGAVDTACWCWAVNKRNDKIAQVDYKKAFDELCLSYEEFLIKDGLTKTKDLKINELA